MSSCSWRDAGPSVRARGRIGIGEIAQDRLILFDRTSSYYELTNAMFREAGVAPQGVIELDNIDAAKKMVEQRSRGGAPAADGGLDRARHRFAPGGDDRRGAADPAPDRGHPPTRRRPASRPGGRLLRGPGDGRHGEHPPMTPAPGRRSAGRPNGPSVEPRRSRARLGGCLGSAAAASGAPSPAPRLGGGASTSSTRGGWTGDDLVAVGQQGRRPPGSSGRGRGSSPRSRRGRRSAPRSTGAGGPAAP